MSRQYQAQAGSTVLAEKFCAPIIIFIDSIYFSRAPGSRSPIWNDSLHAVWKTMVSFEALRRKSQMFALGNFTATYRMICLVP